MSHTAADRRLIVRVHEVWKRTAAGAPPRRSQIDPREYGSDWTNCAMIDLDPVPARSRFAHVGDNLRDPTWPVFDRQVISECLEGSVLELITRHIPRLAVKKRPLSFGGSAVHNDGNVFYRTTLLPLSENGERVDGILAAVTYREAGADEQIPLSEVPLEPRSKPGRGANLAG